jgi:hypothetical protein
MSLRQVYVQHFLEGLSKDATHVTPMELGILQNRYRELYTSTPKILRPRLFEQLCLSVIIWVTLDDDIKRDDTMAYIQVLHDTKRLISTIKERVNGSDGEII